jgi:predicted class III extradiol MEMO1 family dioxygenase
MKKIVAVVALMMTITGAFAQDAISKFFSKYHDDESFTQVNVSSKMFSLFTNMEAETQEDKEVLEAISKLKGLRILMKENTSDARSLYKEAFSLIPVKEFEELMSVRNKDQDIKFYIKETSGKISELVMVMGGMDDFMVMSLFGEIDLKQVSRIGKKMDVKGLENLHNLDKDHKKPAPTSKDNN